MKVEVQATGWLDYRRNYYDRYDRIPWTSVSECRFEQTVWAVVNEKGRPVKIREDQQALAGVACAPPGTIPAKPWYPRRRF